MVSASLKGSASLKREVVEGVGTVTFYINNMKVSKEQYQTVYHAAGVLDAFHTKSIVRRKIKTYVHTCEAREVPQHLIPEVPQDTQKSEG